MATLAADLMFRCVLEGSLSMCDTDIERRPYHKNCECALHKKNGKCSHAGSQQRNVSFPRREFSEKLSFSISASPITCQSSYVHTSSTTSRECTNEDPARY